MQKYIHVFGGDPKRVTVVGESAGGASIMHHVTAYGGTKGPAPFQQAITQSAAWLPVTADRQEDSIFNNFLAAVNATTLEELRTLPLAVIANANSRIVSGSAYGQYSFGIHFFEFLITELTHLQDLRLMVPTSPNCRASCF